MLTLHDLERAGADAALRTRPAPLRLFLPRVRAPSNFLHDFDPSLADLLRPRTGSRSLASGGSPALIAVSSFNTARPSPVPSWSGASSCRSCFVFPRNMPRRGPTGARRCGPSPCSGRLRATSSMASSRRFTLCQRHHAPRATPRPRRARTGSAFAITAMAAPLARWRASASGASSSRRRCPRAHAGTWSRRANVL